MNQPVVNNEPVSVRCGMCGGKTRWCKDPLQKFSARLVECAGKDQPYPFQDAGRCAWSSMDPKRSNPLLYPYWRIRIWLGW